MKDNSPLMDWINTKHHSAKIFVTKMPSSEIAVVLAGLTAAMPEWTNALDAGYHVSRSGRYLLRPVVKGEKISLATVRGIFPRAVSMKMPQNMVFMRSREDDTAKNASSDMRDVAPIGLNFADEEVFDGEGGRFIKRDGKCIREGDLAKAEPATFLRGKDSANLALCADGFVNRIARGEVMRANDLRKYAAIVSGEPGFMRLDDPRLRVIQETVESALQRRQREFSGLDENAFLHSVKLNENQPPLGYRTSGSVMNQQYSTPLPMAIIAQMLLGDVAGKLVREPTIGNGSLVMSLPESTRISAAEIDPARVEQVKVLRGNLEIVAGDFLKAKFAEKADHIISNPPFGGLAKPVVMDKLKVHRLDYQIVLHSLAQRTDEGRGVFIVGADNENKYEARAGEIHGSSRSFFKWLSDHYEVEDIAEFDGRLYVKQGAQFPVRMITVGRRRTDEDAAQRFKQGHFEIGGAHYPLTSDGVAEKLPVVHTWAEAWNHLTGVASVMDSRMNPGLSEGEISGLFDGDGIDVLPGGDEVEADQVPAKEHEINEFQAPYISQSKTGEASTMVPRNLEAPIARALEKFKEATGMSTDEFVVKKLKLGEEELTSFSPEQIDAIALAIYRIEKGRGFVLGDQTGVGKGRTLGGVARYAALRGMPVVFMTKKPNLFTDFWRDVQDINSDDLFKPLIMNEGVPILDQGNQVAVKPTMRNEFNRVVNSDKTLAEEGYNLLMATYSQVNRLGTTKAGFLRRVCGEGALLVIDEAHEAAGASNVGANIADAVSESHGVMYSSATFCKGARNMKVYAKAFPGSVTVDSLGDVLEIGGEPLQEVLSGQLAEDGAFIRREHDLSELEFTVVVDDDNRARNRALADQVSSILRSMAYLSGDVSKQMVGRLQADIRDKMENLSAEQRKGSRMGVNYVNFGSRLYNLLRQFALALKTDFIADCSVKAIREGRKPVIALEQTNETILTEALFDDDLNLEDDAAGEDQLAGELSAAEAKAKEALRADSLDNVMKGVKEVELIDFRHVLRRMLGRLSTIKTCDFYGNVKVESAKSMVPPGMSLEEAEQFAKNYRDNELTIQSMIEALPSLPLSPIDAISQKIEEAGMTGGNAEAGGFSVAEVSGRKLSIRTNEAGNMLVSKRIDQRLKDIYRFNNGDAEAMFITRAGSTGMSVHASERFADQRQRELFELQIANDVNERVQFFGRVNRKGQVCPPRITSASTGLPFEMRMLAMQNAKLRKLSANTQSNRRNAAEIKNVPDVLNPFGNKICKEFLENNPEIATILDIELDAGIEDDRAQQDECYFANKLFGRIALLPVGEQERVMKEVTDEFDRQIAELEAQGANPLKSRELDIRGKVVKSELMVGVERDRYESVFDRPVYLSTIQWQEDRDPIRWSQVQEHADRARIAFAEKGIRQEKRYNWEPPIVVADAFLKVAAATIEKQKSLALPKAFQTVDDAMASEQDNIVKKLDARKEYIKTALERCYPGKILQYSTTSDGEKRGVVIGVEFPPANQEHNLGKYIVVVAMPGQDSPERVSFYHLNSDPAFSEQKELFGYSAEAVAKAFDSAPKGKVTRSVNALTGNLFRAAEMAVERNLGGAVVFTDEEGRRQRGVFLKASVSAEDVRDYPLDLPDGRCAYEYLRFLVSQSAKGEAFINTGESERTLIGRKDTSVTIAVAEHAGTVKISVPGTKEWGGRYFGNKDLIKMVGVEFSGTRDRMSAVTDLDKLEDVVHMMVDLGCKFKASPGHRAEVNEIIFGKSDDDVISQKMAA